jgi:hypothetical protein
MESDPVARTVAASAGQARTVKAFGDAARGSVAMSKVIRNQISFMEVCMLRSPRRAHPDRMSATLSLVQAVASGSGAVGRVVAVATSPGMATDWMMCPPDWLAAPTRT